MMARTWISLDLIILTHTLNFNQVVILLRPKIGPHPKIGHRPDLTSSIPNRTFRMNSYLKTSAKIDVWGMRD